MENLQKNSLPEQNKDHTTNENMPKTQMPPESQLTQNQKREIEPPPQKVVVEVKQSSGIIQFITKNLLKIGIIVGLIAVISGISFSFITTKEEITEKLVGTRLEEAKELISLRYAYTDVGKFENSKNIYGWDLPLTQKRFIIAFDGIATIGVDLNQLKISVNKITKKIYISNLVPKILSHDIDESSLRIFDENASIFNTLKLDDFKRFFEVQRNTVEDKIKRSNLIKQAQKSSKNAIKELLRLDNKIASGYEIIFEEPTK